MKTWSAFCALILLKREAGRGGIKKSPRPVFFLRDVLAI